MHRRFELLASEVDLDGGIHEGMRALLSTHGLIETAVHCEQVAAEAVRLARRFGAEPLSAQVAGWLHDVSAVYPVAQRLSLARELGLDVLPEEKSVPMLLHQKISAAMARELFHVSDRAILAAIRCHTTLRAHASRLDQAVFVADKIAWDQPGAPPYLEGLLDALKLSLDRAALHYLEYLWQRRHSLPAVHPWLADAYQELSHQTRDRVG
jgi:predicted HD superfamily hydrolase involved in NAD metabolism